MPLGLASTEGLGVAAGGANALAILPGNTLDAMSDDESARDGEAWFPIGIVCGEDIDAVLAQDTEVVRIWATGVLGTALERVAMFGAESHELLKLAIEVLWQYSGGEAGDSTGLAVSRWLDEESPRGRGWSAFASLVQSFIKSMDAKFAAQSSSASRAPSSNDDIPF